jgi:succinate-semialdehyde dehydrogenase/glutarate-semialdehyde dehydrogenase
MTIRPPAGPTGPGPDGAAPTAAAPSVLRVVDPHTGEPVGDVAVGDPAEIAGALARARAAAPGWAAVPPAERAAVVGELARRVRAAAEALARLQTAQMGKPIGDSRGGVAAGIGALEQYAQLGPLHRGRSLQGDPGATDLMVHVPRGVAAVITPWNDPVAITCQLVGANLVAGNTVVLKPSERTPLDAEALTALADGLLPEGVWQTVHGGSAVGSAVVDGDVDVVALVGSVTAGRAVAAACAPRFVSCVLELGGKDALVVDADVDPAWAAGQAALGAFANSGQICTSVERIYVHRGVADAFLEALVERARSLVVGDPLDDATDLGPLVDRAHVAHVRGHLDDAAGRGATLRCGGEVLPGTGCHLTPAVLTGVTDDMAVMVEETFGPVAPVAVVDDFDEGLERAATGAHGLAATVLTADADRAQRATRRLEVGTVKVNAVFGGAPGGAAHPRRASGSGFGYGPELLDELTATRVVHLSPATRPAP